MFRVRVTLWNIFTPVETNKNVVDYKQVELSLAYVQQWRTKKKTKEGRTDDNLTNEKEERDRQGSARESNSSILTEWKNEFEYLGLKGTQACHKHIVARLSGG